MSLRSRLLTGLGLLLAFGLTTVNIATYFSLKSFLLDRTDQELSQSSSSMLHLTLRAANGIPVSGNPNIGSNSANSFPTGAVGELYSSSGGIVGTIHITYGISQNFPAPTVPKSILTNLSTVSENLNPSSLPSTTLLTSNSSPSGVSYRVLLEPVGNGLVLIEAFPLNDMESTLNNLRNLELLISSGAIIVIGLLAWLIVDIGLKPLEKVRMTTRAIASGDIKRRVEVSSLKTEVGQLSHDFNEMVDRIEEEFEMRAKTENRLRRFISDASHELRTPLAFIRGHAELFRRGASENPADLAESMRRIEEQAERMGKLVDELLLLARLDEGLPLESEKVDLRITALDALVDARALDPTRQMKIEAPTPVEITGDEAKIRQVVANLVRNALIHTPRETPIEINVKGDLEFGILEVIDHGTGLEKEHAEHVFDRFYRADTSRSRDHGGSGLGLAIVSAIVNTHRGKVFLTETPGGGATFTIMLRRNI